MNDVHRHRVRYHEVDQQGFLFNSRFLEIADVAMAEYFRHLGWSYFELNRAGMDPSVVDVRLRCTSPARFDDTLDVHVTCTRIGHSSFILVQEIHCLDRPVATADITYVNIDARTAQSRPIPRTLANTLAAKESP